MNTLSKEVDELRLMLRRKDPYDFTREGTYHSWRKNFYQELQKVIKAQYSILLQKGIIDFQGDTLVLCAPYSMQTFKEVLHEIIPNHYPETYFDMDVKIMSAVHCDSLFDSYEIFNSDVTFEVGGDENNWGSFKRMFYGCENFDREVIIPEGVKDTTHMFANCVSLNSKVTLPSTLENSRSMFLSCEKFNQPMRIPKSLKCGVSMFCNCEKLNSDIFIEDGCEAYLTHMLRGCWSFNAKIELPDSIRDVEGIFEECTHFNQRFNIPKSCKVLDCMLRRCRHFNQPLDLPEGVDSASNMLEDCEEFNSGINLPSTLIRGDRMFAGCTNFNHELNLPDSLIHYRFIFKRCKALDRREQYINQLKDNFSVRKIPLSEYSGDY